MRRKLTDAFIKTLKVPETDRLEVWDTEQRCFGLRVTENGIKTWTLKYKFRGRQRRSSTTPEYNRREVANHTLRLLKSMFNRAAREFGMFSGDNPAVGVALFKEKQGTRFLSTDEMRRMVRALEAEQDACWRTYFMLALVLGTRRNELLAARWSEVDFERQTLRLPGSNTKSGRERVLPLPPATLQFLDSLPRRGDFIFAGEGSTGHRINVKRAWKRVCERADVKGCRLHDLRHTVGSWLSMAGCNLQVVSRVLGHESTAMAEKYSHLNLAPIKMVLEANARAMLELSAESPADEPKALPAPIIEPKTSAAA
jgi:integrase